MAAIIVGNKNNVLTSAFNSSTGVVTVSNCLNFPLNEKSLVSIYDSTVSLPFNMLQNITFAYTRVSGQPVYSWTFPVVPAGAGNGDTLVITLEIPQNQVDPSINLVTSGATI